MLDNRVSIEVRDVSKVYKLYEKPSERLKEVLSLKKRARHKEHYALNNINFEVKRGETFGIIGTNGAGKSTLLKIITGVASSTTGQIIVNGKIAALLELGAGFNMDYTGLANIYLNGTMMGFTRKEMEKRVNGILEFADIGEFIYQPVKTYSSGMFARLAFAVAINIEPEILIVDEALSVGDVFFQNKCYRKFEELRRKNTTVIFVSHDLGSVRQMCSRVLWLEKGTLQMMGNTKEVCDAYANARMKDTNDYNMKCFESDEGEIGQIKKKKKLLDNIPAIRKEADGMYNEDVEIISVFVADNADDIKDEIIAGEQYNINMVVRFKKSYSGVIFGFSMENIKGVKIMGENTYAKQKLRYTVKEKEVIHVKFGFQMPRIETGNYLISPAVAVGSQETPVILAWINSAYQIRVERAGYNLAFIDLDYKIAVEKIDLNSVTIL